MIELLGRFHPVLVHLPIGLLLLAALFIWQSRKDRYENLQPAINIILFWGMLSAIAACITGFLLSQSGGYDTGLVNWHQWLGISVCVLSIITYFLRKKGLSGRWQAPGAVLLLFLLFITGHLGGSLTHGPDYLTQPLKNIISGDTPVVFVYKPIANIQEAVVYTDIIQPIFQNNCISCHGSSRQKGKLRVDQPSLLLKGGKDGVVIIPGKADESELIKRISLPREDEHHMAPKDKPQLTEKQISLLRWWIDNGADLVKKVNAFEQPPKIKSLLLSLQHVPSEQVNIPDIPSVTVEKADEAAVKQLVAAGVVLVPVSQNSNYLSADFITTPVVNLPVITVLLRIRKQLVWLKLGNTHCNDEAMTIIGQCTNLTKLQLEHTEITDKGLEKLQSLTKLQSLNLTGTAITAAGILFLKNLKELQHLYLYQTGVERGGWKTLEKAFPKTSLDSGGYRVPALNTDTMIVKPPPKHP